MFRESTSEKNSFRDFEIKKNAFENGSQMVHYKLKIAFSQLSLLQTNVRNCLPYWNSSFMFFPVKIYLGDSPEPGPEGPTRVLAETFNKL